MRTKYVKIERNGFTYAYTTLKAAEHALSIGVIQSYAPVTLKQIKAGHLHHYREADYFRHVGCGYARCPGEAIDRAMDYFNE